MKAKAVGPMRFRSINATMKTTCDICGLQRGGFNPISHKKCSKIRAAAYRSAENAKE